MRPFPDPSILLHPQIPKPLHLMAPRVFLGQEWWDKTRRTAYWQHGYHCHACGVAGEKAQHQKGLEAHEIYDIDYTTGKVEFVEVTAICYFCHNFIHSGRLEQLWRKGTFSVVLYLAILRHGERILAQAGLQADLNTQLVDLLREIGKLCEWEDYHMVINGVRYEQRFKSYEEWEDYWDQERQE